MLFTREKNRLVVSGSGETIWIEPFGTDCVRFRATVAGDVIEQDWTLLPQPSVEAQITIGHGRASIRSGTLSAEVTADGAVRYVAAGGRTLLEELWIDRRTQCANLLKARNYRSVGGDLHRTSLYFRARDGERFYGMGQYANGRLDLKGCVLELAQKNTQISIPVLISTGGYGFIWNNPAVGRAELATNHTMWYAESTRQIDYLVFRAETPADGVRRYADLTGKPPLLPEWAAGFWQSKLRYRTQDEFLGVVREHKRRGLPLSVAVIDYFHWPHQGDWRFDPQYWPDPKGMVEELTRLGVRLMVSVWPTVEITSENYDEMAARGLLVRTERGVPTIATTRGICTYFDATNPEARNYIWRKVKENYYGFGIRAFWLDEAEPELSMRGFGYDNTSAYDYDNLRYHSGNGLEVGNIYPYYYGAAFQDGMRKDDRDDGLRLIRCAWIGSQRLNAVVWSGDIPSTFESLRQQVKAGLNMAMAGIPWWTTDIGGFYGGDPNDPVFRELIVRWFQFGALCPIFRLHGNRLPNPPDANKCPAYELTGGANEIWSFGERAYEILRDLLSLRERLRSYIMAQSRRAHEEGVPIMRPLFFDFPEDDTAYEVEDGYMFGPDLLVAPVLHQGGSSRDVYLPKGARWKNPRTGREHDGGAWVTCDAPLEVIPMFLRDGADVPV